jgi:drug/metabolite transporter (DMT)-like permease
VGSNAAFAVASLGGSLALVSVLSSLYPVVTTLLARELLHERLSRTQLAGVVATIAGTVLIVV